MSVVCLSERPPLELHFCVCQGLGGGVMGPGANPGGGPMMQGPGAPGMAGGPGGYMGQQGYGEPNKGYMNQGMYTRTTGGYPGGPGGYAGRWVFLFYSVLHAEISRVRRQQAG